MSETAVAEQPGPPDVTVVVIAFNDAGRLPRAIRSVQRQTLRALEIVVVDDASTDDTAEVVRALAASDPRIRYERLSQNSGGCSAPRNRGLEMARAPWVMFCDSDDEYERHACKNLLETAERTGADVVCGTAERVDARSGRVRRWRPELHARPLVADTLAEVPDLLYDTISVNKIYRVALLREQGISFPEGLLFEDQLFTLEAMAAARRLAVIPEVVYRWYVDRLTDEPSITQRRHEARNVESRIEVNRRIDAFLTARGLDGIRRAKDLKFIRHDLYLYLSSMLDIDDDAARVLMDRLRPYVSETGLDPVWEVRPALRVAVYHLLVGDLDGIRAAMRFVKWASVVDVPIVRLDGRTMWGSAHLDNGPDAAGRPARDWLDVTQLGLLDIPFTQRRYLHRIESAAVDGGRLVVRGSTVDYDGLVAESSGIELRLLTGGDRTAMTVPAHWTGVRDGRREWEAAGPLTDHLLRPLFERDRGTVALAVSRADLVNVTGARAEESSAPTSRVRYPGRCTSTGPDAVALGPHDNGAIGWRAVQVSGGRRGLMRVRDWWFRIPGTTRLATVFSLIGRDAVPALAARVARLLPAADRVVVHPGAPAPDPNVCALAEELHRARPGVAQVWVFVRDPARVPEGRRAVRAGSARHAWQVGRARLVIVDGRAAVTVPVPPRCLVLSARAEAPVHRIGLDDPSVLVSRAAVAAARRTGRQWSVLTAASAPAGATVADAFAFGGRQVLSGIPRMDSALAALAGGQRDEVRRRLDLPADRPVVLHLPAQREGDDPVIDPDAWAAAEGAAVYLVMRHRVGMAVPTRLRHAVRLLREDDELAEFIVAADLVVSDYSSLIGDAALADRPIVLFQPDHETYVNRTRGLYPDAIGVGPVVFDLPALVAEVNAWVADPDGWDVRHAPGRRAWAQVWTGAADGQAARRVIEAVRS